MRVFVIAGGDFSFDGEILPEDFVICADSGYDAAVKHGIHVNLVLGDMDSSKESVSSNKDVVLFPSRKDYTDTELAVRRGVEMSPDEIILLGCLGSRADHSIANIFLLKYISEMGIKACIADKNNKIYYYKNSFKISHLVGKTVSLIPLTDKITGITTKGLDYSLCGETVCFGETRGISNVVISPHAEYTSEQGEGLIIITNGI